MERKLTTMMKVGREKNGQGEANTNLTVMENGIEMTKFSRHGPPGNSDAAPHTTSSFRCN